MTEEDDSRSSERCSPSGAGRDMMTKLDEIEARHARTAKRVEAQGGWSDGQNEDIAYLLNIARKAARWAVLLDTLAAWDDEAANARLERTGSYGGFDEPASVAAVRAALSGEALIEAAREVRDG